MITIRSHELVRTGQEGNGFHGVCKHCGTPCVTDLGYDSWDFICTVERPVTDSKDFLPEVKHYMRFRGFHFDHKDLKFKRSYSDEEYTIEQFYEIVSKMSGELLDALRGKNEWVTKAVYYARKVLLVELGYQVYWNEEDKNGLVKYGYYY